MKQIPLLLIFAMAPAFAARTSRVDLRWEELPSVGVCRGSKVTVTRSDGSKVRGPILFFHDQGMVLLSDSKGSRVPRSDITAIRVEHGSKRLGRQLGFGYGLIGAARLAIRVGAPEVIPPLLIAGRLLGRRIDARYLDITIVR